jgi:hypothetical protein
MILCFGHLTSEKLNCVMKSFKMLSNEDTIEKRNKFIDKQIQSVQDNKDLKDFFPKDIFAEPKVW